MEGTGKACEISSLKDTLPTLWYDYEVQAWVKYGVYMACSHPACMQCVCHGRQHAGETADPSHFREDT